MNIHIDKGFSNLTFFSWGGGGVRAWNTVYLCCIFVSVADDGTQDLLGPAEYDEGIRVHTIHKLAWGLLKICSAILGVYISLFLLIL